MSLANPPKPFQDMNQQNNINESDETSLETWRQRIEAFRINPDQLSYLDDGRTVASGGFGEVKKAMYNRRTRNRSAMKTATTPNTATSGLTVAVKTLKIYTKINPERFEKRFIREAYVWSRLNNDYIIDFVGFHFSWSEEKTEALLVCPWMENGESFHYVTQQRLPVVERLHLVLDAAKGLQYLHSRVPPICHGDIKSSNVMIRHDGRAVLCDFGLAQVLDEEFERLASQSYHRGTLRWTSPERLSQDEPIAPSSDIWSWAWLIWQFLTEKDPFHTTNNHNIVMYNIIFLKLPVSDQEPAISKVPTLSKLMELCWQKEPESRLRIDECIDRLERIFEIFELPKTSGKSQDQRSQLEGPSEELRPTGRLSFPPKPPPKSLPTPTKDTFGEQSVPGPPLSQLASSVPPSGAFSRHPPPPPTTVDRILLPTTEKDASSNTPATPWHAKSLRQGESSEEQPSQSQISNKVARTGFRKLTKRLLSISKRTPQRSRDVEEISEWDIIDPQPDPGTGGNESRSTNPADLILETLREHPRAEQVKILSNVLQKFESTSEINQDIANYINRLNRWLSEVPVFGSPDVLVQPRAPPPTALRQPLVILSERGSSREDSVERSVASAGPSEMLEEGSIRDSIASSVSRSLSPSLASNSISEISTTYDAVARGPRFPVRESDRDRDRDRDRENHVTRRRGASAEVYRHLIRRFNPSEIEMYPNSVFGRKDQAQAGVILVTRKPIAIKPVNFHPENGVRASEISIMSEFDKWLEHWGSLEHENIAKLLGSTFVGGVPSVITERCKGGNLIQYLEKSPKTNRRNLVRQVAQGLDYLHTAHATTHSNLKPNNVLIDDGRVMLGDIGILEFLDTRGVGGGMHGKTGDARWTAPEVFEGRGYQWWSDVYSFGCLALLILRGKLPYGPLKTDVAVIQAIYRGELPINRDLASALHPTWKLCWTQDYQRRPTMSTILESLDSW